MGAGLGKKLASVHWNVAGQTAAAAHDLDRTSVTPEVEAETSEAIAEPAIA